MTNTYPRETLEVIGLNVRDAGTPTTNYTVQITEYSERPTDTGWVNNVTVTGPRGTITGVLLDAATLGPGTYRIWVHVVANPEIPVIDCGWFIVD